MSKAKRWKPKEGENYFRGHEDGKVEEWIWINDNSDKYAYRLGNCFKTRSEATAVARKLKGFWKDVREGR